ncbi:YaaC family protein [Bacillus sp. FJAT-45350]|uniref:YaaC family protein n=1 Tax=Bacillus sp. FJAT-45350 TaxID=2011014 RepID=UPI000BB932E0|nr:YaaC family protein [Bacillus sp. FJAT-45350]
MNRDTHTWKELSKYQSTSFTQSYLKKCYEQLDIPEAEKLGFQNCYPFIYYLEHGEKYFKQLKTAPLELHPILLFYGFVQLIKACILTKDPSYPENSQVLAHGVSTRKRKKAQYLFLDDEVKLQKNGLLTHFSDKMFHVKHFSGDKYKMEQLMRQIPELHELFFYVKGKTYTYPIKKETDRKITFSTKILDDFNLSCSSFMHFFKARTELSISDIEETEKKITIYLKGKLEPLHATPLLFNSNGSYHILNRRDDYLLLPEIVVHYLILYNLSMICRYETEWWGELFHHYPEADFPFIKEFLSITTEKIPYLLFLYLDSLIK